jgi:hypothetical protein
VALRYAGGIGAMQIYWIALILLLSPDTPLMMAAFSGGFAGELVIPAVVEKNGHTNWHRHHIIERYGLSAIGSGCRPPPNGYYR